MLNSVCTNSSHSSPLTFMNRTSYNQRQQQPESLTLLCQGLAKETPIPPFFLKCNVGPQSDKIINLIIVVTEGKKNTHTHTYNVQAHTHTEQLYSFVSLHDCSIKGFLCFVPKSVTIHLNLFNRFYPTPHPLQPPMVSMCFIAVFF